MSLGFVVARLRTLVLRRRAQGTSWVVSRLRTLVLRRRAQGTSWWCLASAPLSSAGVHPGNLFWWCAEREDLRQRRSLQSTSTYVHSSRSPDAHVQGTLKTDSGSLSSSSSTWYASPSASSCPLKVPLKPNFFRVLWAARKTRQVSGTVVLRLVLVACLLDHFPTSVKKSVSSSRQCLFWTGLPKRPAPVSHFTMSTSRCPLLGMTWRVGPNHAARYHVEGLQGVALIGAFFFFRKIAVSVALNGAASLPCCIIWCLHAFSTEAEKNMFFGSKNVCGRDMSRSVCCALWCVSHYFTQQK